MTRTEIETFVNIEGCNVSQLTGCSFTEKSKTTVTDWNEREITKDIMYEYVNSMTDDYRIKEHITNGVKWFHFSWRNNKLK